MESICIFLQPFFQSEWAIGILSGIVATLIWWFITHILFAAKIEISNLQVYRGGKGQAFDYYLRIQNRSRFRPIYDIECYCIFKDNNKEMVYVKDSRSYKFTALGQHPTIFKTLLKKYQIEREKFKNEDSNTVQDLPNDACILLNSIIYKQPRDGLNVSFSQPLYTQYVKSTDLECIFRYDFPHTLFIVIKTTSPFGVTRTISRNIICDLPTIEKRFEKAKDSTKNERREFLKNKFLN